MIIVSNLFYLHFFLNNIVQFILSIFLDRICIVFGLIDNQYHSILSLFFSNRCIAFGLLDKHNQFILSLFFSKRSIAFYFKYLFKNIYLKIF